MAAPEVPCAVQFEVPYCEVPCYGDTAEGLDIRLESDMELAVGIVAEVAADSCSLEAHSCTVD